MIDDAAPGATIVCDTEAQFELSAPLVIKKPMALKGLNARLPRGLGRTSLIVVDAVGVALTDIELHGNYDSVDQQDRASLIKIRKGNFRLERCKFYDSSKDGVEISPESGGTDIVGGIIRDIEAFRIGRDAVSISGGNQGLRVRDVTVENVSLSKGYLRGAVEVSDGTDNIRVRGVYAEDCPYAIDVQDHRGRSAANTNIDIEDVTAVNCRHIIRTANSPRGHAKLRLRNFTGKNCEAPVKISNTKDITIDGLKVLNHQSQKYPPISLENCRGVHLENVSLETAHFADQPVRLKNCADVDLTGIELFY
ncbi:MAG: hypothetical protein IH892_09610 [Planctomycetes bacterium]|nr:hypothetical protein [Planctomycetota bacterium]